jgi:hypothetical protein
VTTVTAAIELLVGAACVALSWVSWRHGGTAFRIVAACLASAGIVAMVNAVATVL